MWLGNASRQVAPFRSWIDLLYRCIDSLSIHLKRKRYIPNLINKNSRHIRVCRSAARHGFCAVAGIFAQKWSVLAAAGDWQVRVLKNVQNLTIYVIMNNM